MKEDLIEGVLYEHEKYGNGEATSQLVISLSTRRNPGTDEARVQPVGIKGMKIPIGWSFSEDPGFVKADLGDWAAATLYKASRENQFSKSISTYEDTHRDFIPEMSSLVQMLWSDINGYVSSSFSNSTTLQKWFSISEEKRTRPRVNAITLDLVGLDAPEQEWEVEEEEAGHVDLETILSGPRSRMHKISFQVDLVWHEDQSLSEDIFLKTGVIDLYPENLESSEDFLDLTLDEKILQYINTDPGIDRLAMTMYYIHSWCSACLAKGYKSDNLTLL